MHSNRILIVLLLLSCAGCSRPQPDTTGLVHSFACDNSFIDDSLGSNLVPSIVRKGALLGSRFKSLEELKSVIQIEYVNDNAATDNHPCKCKGLYKTLQQCGGGYQCVLEAGISQ